MVWPRYAKFGTIPILKKPIGNFLGVLRGEVPEVMKAEAMAKAKMACELIYKMGNYSKRELLPQNPS